MREIQDSDDEVDDLEANIPPPQQSVAYAQEHNVSPQHHGTGSTGKVSCDSRIAFIC